MNLKENEVRVEILPDGSVKITTGSFGGPIHSSAEAMMRAIESELGGDATHERDEHAHAHHHDHDHAEKGHHHGH
jgi:hypothetical protein